MTTRLEIGRHGNAIAAVYYQDEEPLAAVFDRADAPDETDAVFAVRPSRRLSQREATLVDLGDGREGLIRGAPTDQAVFLAQVSKPARAGKRAELRPDIALPGRALVHVPGGGRLSLSARLTDKKAAKARARSLGLEHGWVLRSGFMDYEDGEISTEAAHLADLGRSLISATAPGLVLAPPPVWRRLTDAYGWPDTMVIDPQCGLEAPPGAKSGVLDLSGYFQDHTAARVDLPKGGGLWVEQTHAFVAVDVDSGPMGIGEANRVAVAQLAAILRLRNLSGTIVVDMVSGEQDPSGLVDNWRAALARDWVAVTPPSRLSPLGLAEIARQRRGYSIHQALAPTTG